ncbi:uncharacterized protein PG998_007119 [Apiospora kogelbergensis]|uniref:uncharacterized protein n=1 Tax=Apiospora kogelbergensis TaxID=1337665 RepID=UPI003130E9AD
MENASRRNTNGPWDHEYLRFNNEFCDIPFNSYTPISTNPQEDPSFEDLSMQWMFPSYELGGHDQTMPLEPYASSYLTPEQHQDGLSEISSPGSSLVSYTPYIDLSSDNYVSTILQPIPNGLVDSGPTSWTPNYVNSTMSFPGPSSYPSDHDPSTINKEETMSSLAVSNTSNESSPPPPSSMKTIPEPVFCAYICPHCPRSFPKRFQLNIHVQRHTKPFACPVFECETKHGAQRDLYRHMWTKHAKDAAKSVEWTI